MKSQETQTLYNHLVHLTVSLFSKKNYPIKNSKHDLIPCKVIFS